MAISFTCPKCKTAYTVNDSDAGKKSNCAKCGQRVQVPRPRSAPVANKTRLGELIEAAPAVDVASTIDSRPAAMPLLPPALPANRRRANWMIDIPGEQQASVVDETTLREMAASGRLRRRDFVRRDGERRWQRAGLVASLWSPAPSDPASLLTTCGACLNKIAKEAPTCPKCGAPNHWVHSEIARFFRRTRLFQRRYPSFTWEGKCYTLIGRSVRDPKFLDYAANAVGSMGFIGFGVGGLVEALGASIGSQYAAKALRDWAGPGVHAFVIDFRSNPPHWNTTDDEFWAFAIDFFDLV